ncbi:MAG: hypothetical protein KJ906_00490 [Nanoarchaeota archaeon]|nr:hypothetical protein [Nanoarchaeota archaeon]
MRGIDILKEIETILFEKRNEQQIADVLNFNVNRNAGTTYQYSMISKDSDIATYVQYYDHSTCLWSSKLKEASEKYVSPTTMKEAKDNNSILLGTYGQHHEDLYLLSRLEFNRFLEESEKKVLEGELGANYGIVIADKERIHPREAKFQAGGNNISFYFTNIEQHVLGMNPEDKIGLHMSGSNIDIHMNTRPLQTNIDEIKRIGNDTLELLTVLEEHKIYDKIKEFQKKTSVNII